MQDGDPEDKRKRRRNRNDHSRACRCAWQTTPCGGTPTKVSRQCTGPCRPARKATRIPTLQHPGHSCNATNSAQRSRSSRNTCLPICLPVLLPRNSKFCAHWPNQPSSCLRQPVPCCAGRLRARAPHTYPTCATVVFSSKTTGQVRIQQVSSLGISRERPAGEGGWSRARQVLLSNWPKKQVEPPFHTAVSQAPPRLGVS